MLSKLVLRSHYLRKSLAFTKAITTKNINEDAKAMDPEQPSMFRTFDSYKVVVDKNDKTLDKEEFREPIPGTIPDIPH